MPRPTALHTAAGLLCLLVVGPWTAGAQEVPTELDGRIIERVSFPGAAALTDGMLGPVIATQETRCRGLLLVPFCWVIDSDVIIERHRLDAEELPHDRLRLLVVYYRAGFREARVASEAVARGDGVEIRFRIEEGPPTVVESLEVEQAEEVLGTRQIRAADLPGEGDPLNLDQLGEARLALADALAQRGYLDAEVRDTIEIAERVARVRIQIDPGPRATVRELEILGNERVEEETITRALYVEEGELLTSTLVRMSRRALHQSNLFYEADVLVPEQADSAKVVTIQVREAPPRLGRIGAGLNTLEFGQLEGRFTHYNWLGQGRRLDLRASLGNLLAPQLNDRFVFGDILPIEELAGVDPTPFERPTWHVSAEFTQPHFRAAENTLSFTAFSHRRVIPGISVDRGFGGESTFTRTLAARAPVSLTYRYEITSTTAGDVYFCVNFGICEITAVAALRRRSSMAPLTLGAQIDRSDDPLGPTTGYRARLDLEHASGATLSDFRYHRISGSASYYHPFGDEPPHVAAAHLRVGWVDPLGGTARALDLAQDVTDLLHPRKRFFAGGARSVRGYPENQLGPRVLTIPRDELLEAGCTAEEVDAGTCDPALAPTEVFTPRPLGGTSVLEGSLEYRFPIGTARGALFLDGAFVGGRIGGFLQDAAAALTPGVGVRFASPAGPIRIDLGYRPRIAANLPVVTESEEETANEVVERELVVLQERRRFDPLEEEGWLGRVLGRLTLHFSIGEAF